MISEKTPIMKIDAFTPTPAILCGMDH